MSNPDEPLEIYMKWLRACARIGGDRSLRLLCPSCGAATLQIAEEPLAEKLERERGNPLSNRERSYVADARSNFVVCTLCCPACGETRSVTTMEHVRE